RRPVRDGERVMAHDVPIIMSAPMVRALLDGRKEQTRRLAYHPAKRNIFEAPSPWRTLYDRWQAGERDVRIWVRETLTRSGGYTQYNADHRNGRLLWPAHWKQDPRPSIHMPRAFSRLT